MKYTQKMVLFLFFALFTSSAFAAKTPTLGFDTESAGYKKFKVGYFYPNAMSLNSGLRPGDILISVDGKSLDENELFRYLCQKLGQDCELTVLRGNTKLKFTVTVEPLDFYYDIFPEQTVIANLLNKGEQIFVMVAVGKIEFMDPEKTYKGNVQEWKRTIRAQLQTQEESLLMRTFNEDSNFSVVDRNEIQSLLEEIRFAQSGYVNKSTRLKIGELTGATHLLTANYSRRVYRKGSQWLMDNTVVSRLININTGKVFSSKSIQETLDADTGKPIKSGWHRLQ